jgi:hypothetical protein
MRNYSNSNRAGRIACVQYYGTGKDSREVRLTLRRLETTALDRRDLTKVDKISLIDLMPSSGHGPCGWSPVGQIEVYAHPGAR